MRGELDGGGMKDVILNGSIPNAETGCREWTGKKNHDGYGLLWLKGRHWRAHRVAYEVFVGRIPKGMHICHSCDNPGCVEPSHLWAGTNLDNVRDRNQKNRQFRAKGEANGRAKLTNSDVRAIRKSKETNTQISQKYGMSQANISQIRSRTLWPHIK